MTRGEKNTVGSEDVVCVFCEVDVVCVDLDMKGPARLLTEPISRPRNRPSRTQPADSGWKILAGDWVRLISPVGSPLGPYFGFGCNEWLGDSRIWCVSV